MNKKNVIIPSKDELGKIAESYYPTGTRESIQTGTNCSGETLNYIKNGENIRLFTKKAFIRGDITQFEEDYKIIKSRFKNIIPNQGFVGVRGTLFAFCAPIGIKVDVLGKNNRTYIVELLKLEPKLLKQFRFFIKVFEELQQEGNILDLYGTENLVISDDNKLYYLDSFLFFHKSNHVTEGSLSNLEYLKEIIAEVENSSVVSTKEEESK